MTPTQIRQALVAQGITQVEIAIVAKVSPARVSEVISLHRRTPRIRKVVAQAVGKDIKEVFPDERFRRPSGRIRVPSSFFRQSQPTAA